MSDQQGLSVAIIPTNRLEPIPTGKYLAVITESSLKPAKSGTSQNLDLTFQITEGPYQNRLLSTRILIDGGNGPSRNNKKNELSLLCRAIQVETPSNPAELHDRPLVICVRRTNRAETGEAINEVRGFLHKSEMPLPRDLSLAIYATPPWAT